MVSDGWTQAITLFFFLFGEECGFMCGSTSLVIIDFTDVLLFFSLFIKLTPSVALLVYAQNLILYSPWLLLSFQSVDRPTWDHPLRTNFDGVLQLTGVPKLLPILDYYKLFFPIIFCFLM